MLGKALLSASVSAGPAAYVEDVFSTYLYTGNSSTQTITNGIDLAGEGGMVWLKGRSQGSGYQHYLYDTERGRSAGAIRCPSTSGNDPTALTDRDLISFDSSGFTLGAPYNHNINQTGETFASWTFRKAEKFFDVVTYTGDGVSGRAIAHNLGSTPGCVIIKRLDSTADWFVWHRSSVSNEGGLLNSTDAFASNYNFADSTPSLTSFFVKNPTYDSGGTNASGGTYVAYLFAHDAGGFGTAGTDNVVSCGSYTGTGAAGNRIELGWEPQFILYKAASTVGDWGIHDSMRGLGVGTSATSGSGNRLEPNTSDAETGSSNFANIDATGFTITAAVSDINGSGQTYIYIAIRRGPMRAPESGTEVFAASTAAANTLLATGITSLDGAFIVNRTINGGARFFFSRLTASRGLDPTSTAAEANYGTAISWDLNNAFYQSAIGSSVQWLFRRAPGFFDVVAWTASASTSITHGLGVTPELIIAKSRSVAGESWTVYTQPGGRGNVLFLNTTNSNVGIADYWGTSGPTATTFGVAASGSSNNAGNMIAYLFATCPGVSKVGSYTGTGTTLNVDCGFTAGARFVLIKRTDSTGDWYVWDTARGIISGNDPYLLLNSTAAEVTNTDYIDPLSSGFQISSTAPAAINASGGTYIFLSIA
jgi:hypothetical protein